MGGGLINIVSYGLDDLYLTGAAQITFFKSSYRRHTNYSQESIEIDIGQTNFGDEITIPFPKVGDLFGNTYLQVNLPQISLQKTDLTSDLTAYETAFLQGPITVPFESQPLQNVVNDYATINAFMKTNMAGYRIAQKNMNIKNQTVATYISAIQSVLTFPSTNSSVSLELDYQNALQKALLYEHSLENYSDDVILNYITSDISYILNNISYSSSTYSVQDVANLVFTATAISVKVKNYYFMKVKQMAQINTDYSSVNAKFAWIDKLGHGIIQKIDVNIGGDRIDRHYFDYIEIWHDLTGLNSQDNLYNKMIGNVVELTTFDRTTKPQYTLTIPLNFWFCKKAGLYFPIVALQYSQISLTIKFNNIDRCAYVEKLPTVDNNGDPLNISQLSLSDIWENMGYFLTANLLTDYIYLDSQERKRFAQSAHEYLIETTQRMILKDSYDHHPSILLDFTGPVKEIMWYAQKNAYLAGSATQQKFLFNYTSTPSGIGNPFLSSELTLNGKSLFNSSITTFHTCVQPYARHTRVPQDGINIYSFCLWPEEHQPSGTCNFSVIPNCVLTFDIDPNMFTYNLSDIDPNIAIGEIDTNTGLLIDKLQNTTINLVVIVKKYDILRVVGGMSGFAFKYMT
jgi:hypothetical protein